MDAHVPIPVIRMLHMPDFYMILVYILMEIAHMEHSDDRIGCMGAHFDLRLIPLACIDSKLSNAPPLDP